MKFSLSVGGFYFVPSPLAEGRELKYPPNHAESASAPASPLAEGRELKYIDAKRLQGLVLSPLAEGRELKWLMVLVS